MDLMFPFKQTQNENDYIVVMQDQFTKWVEDRAICGKTALSVAVTVVQHYVLKHANPPSPYTMVGAMNLTQNSTRGVCHLLHITKMYSTAYCPKANGMVERCNRMHLAMC